WIVRYAAKPESLKRQPSAPSTASEPASVRAAHQTAAARPIKQIPAKCSSPATVVAAAGFWRIQTDPQNQQRREKDMQNYRQDFQAQVEELERKWQSPRHRGILRPYTAETVVRLRGSVRVEHTLAQMGAEKLWDLLTKEPFVRALGTLTGNQAVQQAKAGLKALYV